MNYHLLYPKTKNTYSGIYEANKDVCRKYVVHSVMKYIIIYCGSFR